MPKQSGKRGLPTKAAAQFAVGTSVLRFVWDHPANSGHRVRAVLRAVRYQARVRLLRRRAMTLLGERSRLWVDPHRTAASKVLYANPPDLPEMLVWRRVLRDGGLFVDVGANVGTYTIWAAELGAEVIAVEPAADTFALLAENIALNGYRVSAVQAAAGDHCGTARFTAGLDAANSLAADGPVVTELVTVDSLVGDRWVTGMKIDVEGFELDVLRGAAAALAEQRIGLIQIEWNEASRFALGTDRRPVAELLAGYGYELYRPDAKGCLAEVENPGFGADVFASPALRTHGQPTASEPQGSKVPKVLRLHCVAEYTLSVIIVGDLESLRERLYLSYVSQHSGPGSPDATAMIYRRDIRPLLPPPSAGPVADIGCGSGDLVRCLLADGYQASGIDVSPEQVALAHESGLSQVKQGDYLAMLADRPGQLAAVTATDLLEHLTKPEVLATFDAVAAALAPGGRFVARVPNAVSPFGGHIRYGDFTHETWFTARSVRQLAAAAGLEPISVTGCPPPVHGALSAARMAIWKPVSGLFKLALAAETGTVRGHIVTQNLTFAAAMPHTGSPSGAGRPDIAGR